MKQAILQALEDRYNAQISEADATIKIYLENSVGIGEHPQHIDEVDKLIEKIAAIGEQIIIGNPQDPKTQLGAVISEQQLERIMDFIEIGKAEGANLYCGGERVLRETGGSYFQPTIFDNVSNDMRIAQEEIFGPVLSVITFQNDHDAVAIANASDYGLSAGVWCQDIDRALSVAGAIRVGQVCVNSYDSTDQTVPWCGFKQSGNGVDKSLHALDHYTGLKTTWIESVQM